MVLIKVYANSFYSYKEVDLETANKIKDYVNDRKFLIHDLNIDLKNPLKAKIITDLKCIENVKEFFEGELLFDDKNIIKCIQEDILNLEYKNKLNDYINYFPDYSDTMKHISGDYTNQFCYKTGEYEYINHDRIRNYTDNFIGILILLELKFELLKLSKIIGSYLDINFFKSDLIEIHPDLFDEGNYSCVIL